MEQVTFKMKIKIEGEVSSRRHYKTLEFPMTEDDDYYEEDDYEY